MKISTENFFYSQTVSCQLGGAWSDEPPACRFVDCNIPDDIAHGEVCYVKNF